MEIPKINVVTPDEVRILPIAEEASDRKSISPDTISDCSLKKASGAGQRRLRTETMPNANIALAGKQDIDAILRKYRNYPRGLNRLNYAIEMGDWATAEASINAKIGLDEAELIVQGNQKWIASGCVEKFLRSLTA